MGVLLGAVSVEPMPETYVVEVRVTHNDPKDAALWANTLADVYMDYSIEGQVEAAKRAYKWVTERLAETQTGMQEAQDKLLKSYQGQDLFVPEGSVSAITTSITKLNEDHIQAQARQDRARGAARRVRGGAPARARPRRDPPGRRRRDGLGDQREDPVPDRRPRAAAREVQGGPPGGPEGPGPDAAAAQGPGRPRRADRGGPARRVPPAPAQGGRAQGGDRRPQGPGRRAEPEADRARVAQEEGRRRGRALRRAAAEAERDEHRRLAPEQQRAPARPRGGADERPCGPASARSPSWRLLAGLLLGAGWVLLRDALDNTLKDAEDVERHLHLELLAAIPRYGKDDATLATEAYQNLRTALLFSRRGEAGQVVLVTGTAPGEGKTTTLLNVAKLLAVSGRERRGRGLRPAPRQPAPAPERPARAGLHGLLREERGPVGRWCGRPGFPNLCGDPGRHRSRRTRRRCSRGPSSARPSPS